MAEIRLEHVHKFFGKVHAVKDVSLTVRDGEFVVLLGPSGCGKTTLLRSVAGLERIDAGRISIGGREVTDLPPRKRRIAMVFQSYAVFPHMTIYDNIAFGLRMQKRTAREIEARVRSAAELLHIEDLLERYPAAASGGQRQRIAVARAIAVEPEVLLMDEPLSNLDALLRLEMRAELKHLLADIGATTLYVTHDQVEALSMGDRVAVMNGGTIVQVDDPLSIYRQPADRFVAGFIGNPPMNVVEVSTSVEGEELRIAFGEGVEARVPARDVDARFGSRPVLLGVRAEDISVVEEARPNAVAAEVLVVEPLGSHDLLTVVVGAARLKVIARSGSAIAAGDRIWLALPPDRLWWLDRETGRAMARAGVSSTS